MFLVTKRAKGCGKCLLTLDVLWLEIKSSIGVHVMSM